MMECQCEHVTHFDGDCHEYGDVAATVIVQTTYGATHMCDNCREWHADTRLF